MTLRTTDRFGTTTRVKTFRKPAASPDASPACPTWRPAQAAAYLGCSVRMVWRLAAADPTFPRPRKVSHRVTVFVRADVEAWNERRLAAAK